MNNELNHLRGRRAAVDMTGDEFRALGHKMVDELASFIDTIRERPVNYDVQPSELRARMPADDVPLDGADAGELLEETARFLFDTSTLLGHPKFLGYITAAPTPIGALADLLGSAVNPNVGGWQLSPSATEVEKQTIGWLAQMIGFAHDCAGIFVSGGNMANFVCFLAARRAKAGAEARSKGIREGGQLLAYATSETHVWIQKALDFFGHGTDAIRTIPIDKHQRADVESLHKQIEDDRKEGNRPFIIIGTGGTVSTGAIDPLTDMAPIAKEYDIWMHVDGAYGGLAAILPDAPKELLGIAHADSVAIDPHKWLYAPLEAGCALVRDPEALPNAFSYQPPYYHFESESEPKTNFYEYGFQNSRGFRALKVWLAIRQVGRKGYERMIADDIALAREMYRVFDEHSEFESLTHNLSITTFRYVPSDLNFDGKNREEYLNKLNENILERLKLSGELFLSNAVVDGKYALRGCIVNFRTSLEDIEAMPAIVLKHARDADRMLRPESAK